MTLSSISDIATNYWNRLYEVSRTLPARQLQLMTAEEFVKKHGQARLDPLALDASRKPEYDERTGIAWVPVASTRDTLKILGELKPRPSEYYPGCDYSKFIFDAARGFVGLPCSKSDDGLEQAKMRIERYVTTLGTDINESFAPYQKSQLDLARSAIEAAKQSVSSDDSLLSSRGFVVRKD